LLELTHQKSGDHRCIPKTNPTGEVVMNRNAQNPKLNETMTFGEHLEALRWHLIRALIGVAVCLTVCLILGQRLLTFLLAPLQRALDAHGAGEIIVPTITAGLAAFFEISMVGGLILASPWVIYQLWGFVAPGLYAAEKRLVYRSVPLFVGLFVIGVVFGWTIVLPSSLDFMIRFNQGAGLQHQITVSSWATFAVVFPAAFGLAFELPLAMVVLSKIGLATEAGLRKYRRLAIVIASIVSAVLTPSPNPMDMIMMLIPLILLYEAGIWCVWLGQRGWARQRAPEDFDGSGDLLGSLLIPLLTVTRRSR
jgi:sec-independent protein translocase protein TatC